MYIQCPECNQPYDISTEELHSYHGLIRCDACSAMFNALEILNKDRVTESAVTNEVFPVLIKKSKNTVFWAIGYTLCLIILVFQIVFFEGYNLTQSTVLRPWLLKTCDLLNCQLPDYKNLDEYTILYGSFELDKSGVYVFKATFTNQSAFEQNYPSIKLTLIDFNGNTFAERVFRPEDYSKTPLGRIKSDMAAEITLQLVQPSNSIGGYRFELI